MKRCLHCQKTFNQPSWQCPFCRWLPNLVEGIPVFAPELSQTSEHFKADYFELLASLEAGHFWFNSRNTLLGWVLKKHGQASGNMLEIGCGTGFVLAYLHERFPDLHLTGADIFIEGLRFARSRTPAATFLQLNALAMPFVEEFDVAGVFDVLEHIEDDTGVLQQLHQSLRPGGLLLVTVPQHPWLWSIYDEHSCHKRRYTRQELINKVQQTGFRVVYLTSFVSLLLPAMFCARKRGSGARESYRIEDGLRIAPWANRMGAWLMKLELSLLRAGIKFPAGGSLLLAARRG